MTHPKQISVKGDFDTFYNLIRIRHNESVPLDQQEGTLLHEIVEAIVDINCINIDHTVLSVIAAGLYQVLKENDLDFREINAESHPKS